MRRSFSFVGIAVGGVILTGFPFVHRAWTQQQRDSQDSQQQKKSYITPFKVPEAKMEAIERLFGHDEAEKIREGKTEYAPGADELVDDMALYNPPLLSLPQDSFRPLSASSKTSGTLAYSVGADLLKEPPPWGEFVAIRQMDGEKITTHFYPLSTNDAVSVMRPLMLSDHKRIILEVGFPRDRYGPFHLYLLDTGAGTLRRLTKKAIVNESLAISPDEKSISFVRGADRLGARLNASQPIRLCVLNIESGEERVITSNDTVTSGGFAWMPSGALLYSAVPPLAPSLKGAASKTPIPHRRPNMYEVSDLKSKPKLLVEDAWKPLPSPDGSQIAFMGAENVRQAAPLGVNWRDTPRGASLCLVHADGSGRRALDRQNGTYPQLLWMPDNKRLLVEQTLQQGATFDIVLRELDTTNGTLKDLGQLSTHDSEPLPRPLSLLAPVTPLEISKDGQHLFATATEYRKPDLPSSTYDIETTLLSINLETTSVETIAHLHNSLGVDWREGSPSTTSPTVPTTP